MLFRSVRIRISESLQAICSQRLLPRKDGKGRVVACEVMPVTGTMRDAIRDPTRVDDIYELIEEGHSQYGSQTFDQHLMQLVQEDLVEFMEKGLQGEVTKVEVPRLP